MSSLLDAALEYAGRGWPVLPLGGSGEPKRPRIKDWRNAASVDTEVIRGWWTRWPDAGAAIVTGQRSGVVAIDLDDDDVGGLAYGALVLEHGAPGSANHPDGVAIRTGRDGGGWRLLFSLPANAEIGKGVLAPGVEFMGEGGSAIMPPSKHASGRRYVWRDRFPSSGLPVLSPRWVALLGPRRTTVSVPLPVTLRASGGIGTAYGLSALRSELGRLAAAEEGTRNARLNQTAFCVGTLAAAGHLDLEAALQEVVRVAADTGLSPGEIRSTAQSGVEAGLKSPRAAT